MIKYVYYSLYQRINVSITVICILEAKAELYLVCFFFAG